MSTRRTVVIIIIIIIRLKPHTGQGPLLTGGYLVKDPASELGMRNFSFFFFFCLLGFVSVIVCSC
jgi:hypothetical protein